MSRFRVSASLFAASAIVVGSLIGAAPASAATLPAGATIDVADLTNGGIYSVNPGTAVGTLVGTESGIGGITAIDVNQSGQGYALVASGGDSQLYALNAVTGTMSYLVHLELNATNPEGCQAIDLSTAGVLTVSCTRDEQGVVISTIGTVDPATGAITTITEFSTEEDDIVRALASDAAGTLYVFTEFGSVFTLNTANGETTPVTTIDGRVLGADFDITDQLWVTWGAEGEEPVTGNGLGIVALDTGVLTIVDEYTTSDALELETVSITVWGGTIPSTGASLQDYLPVGIGAVLLLGAGIALAATRRIQHSDD